MATRAAGSPRRRAAAPAPAPAPVSYLPLLPIDEILARLAVIFTDAATQAADARSLISARTIATMLYAAAVDGQGRYVRPTQITSMSDVQYALRSNADRDSWWQDSLRRGYNPADQWYRQNSREGVRDNSIRYALIPNHAVVQLANVPVTSSKGRYALSVDFAALFGPALVGAAFDAAVAAWQSASFGPAALARHVLQKSSAFGAAGNVTVTYPNKATISLSPGKSAEITKAVVEEFATRFMANPAVVWLSESGQKVPDAAIIAALNLTIDPAQQLPDLIIADLGATGGKGFTVVFIEVVHTDGPINDLRKKDLTKIAQNAGFNVADLSYVTAFDDRSKTYRSLSTTLAWGSYVWFRTEPDNLIYLRDAGTPTTLTALTKA
jgi:hypothetical protein